MYDGDGKASRDPVVKGPIVGYIRNGRGAGRAGRSAAGDGGMASSWAGRGGQWTGGGGDTVGTTNSTRWVVVLMGGARDDHFKSGDVLLLLIAGPRILGAISEGRR